MRKKNRALIKGFTSLTAAITNLVQASELADDILHDKNHFLAPQSMKVVFWVTLVLITALEIEKARFRFEEVLQ